MTTYAYIARNAAGQRVTGRLSGGSVQAVLSELEARQLAPVRVDEVRDPVRLRRRISARQLAQMYRQLSDLLRAGVPLLRSLRILGRGKANPRLASIMSEIADQVAEGERLADAMSRHDGLFPPIQIAMVRAGERGGFLQEVLERLGGFLENQADMQSKVLGNLIYPAALMTIGLGIIIVALVFFVPQFRDFYSRMELPLPTIILLGASDLLTQRWPVFVVALVMLGAGLWWMWQQPRIRRAIAAWQLRIPKLGPLLQGLAVSRFTRILGTLLNNGIPMIAAMQISRDAAGHILLAEAIDDAVEAVRAGEPLAQPLAASGLLTDEIAEMIAVGESANNLPEVLLTIAETVEKRVDRMLNVVMRLMEPLLLLGLAGVVLFIFVALIVPMMRMSTAVQG